MKRIKVEIEGTTAILMNKFHIESVDEQKKGRRISKTYDSEDEAKASAYWSSTKKNELIIPAQVIYASILNASSFMRINKRSAKAVLAGSIRIEPEEIPLGTGKYIIDRRAVVIQRARVAKSRARLDKWKVNFDIIYNEKMVANPEIIRTALEDAGMRIGIMDYRPQKSGWYGTFKVNKFDIE